MELVPGFSALLQGLSATMTTPTFTSLTTLLTGGVFARRRTVTRMILAVGDAAGKHFSSYHRLFSAARWSLDALGLAVLGVMQPFLGNVILLGLDDTLARCRRVTLEIDGRRQVARLADQVAHVHAAPERPLRVVATEAVQGGRGQEVFYSTCSDATAEQVIGGYAMRWSIEVMNHDSQQHLGFEEPQGWSRRSVERTAPLARLLYRLIVLWFAREGHRRWRPLLCPWYTSKTEPSFTDMLGTLRRLSIRQRVLTLALTGPGSRKIQQLLENVVALAT